MRNRNRQQKIELSRTLGRNWALGAVLVLCLAFTTSQAEESPQQVSEHTLSSQIKACIGEDGSVELVSETPSGVLLRGSLDSLTDSRRRRGGSSVIESFFALAREGQTGGQRGFSAQADDDGDGLVDEDQLDGLDNDGDGLIDEDFAAVSDAMTAVHLSKGDGRAQLEFMQWAGPRLGNALFLDLAATHELSGVTTPYYHLESTVGSWREVEAFSRRHDLSGSSQTDRATAFVVRIEANESVINLADPSALDFAGPGAGTWLGVMVLDQSLEISGRAQFRPLLEGSRLSLPLKDQPLAAVICIAPSWMQLHRLLMDARAVNKGLSDPVSGQRVPWIVSPLCSRCRLENAVDCTVLENAAGDLTLQLQLQPGQSGLMDPDLFVLGGVSLGSPREITWKPTEGKPVTTPWGIVNNRFLEEADNLPTDLYGSLWTIPSHEARGELVFIFSNPAGTVSQLFEAEKSLDLQGTWMDGRAFSIPCPVVWAASETEGQTDLFDEPSTTEAGPDLNKNHDNRLSLAPGLLEGWPNPFRDQIRIEFVVPSSIRETFDWDVEKPLPTGVDLEAPMAWSGGQPSVSVKVYSINGQELVSLQQGSLAEGRYTVTWNGTDGSGRQVASGTYFCKLQMDEWSVTRRLVFIR